MKRTAAGRSVVWLALENDVPDFRMQGATQRSGWPRQSGADAGANGQISDRFIPLSRAEPVFSQRGGVDVCVYRDRSVKRLPQCLDEIAACPSGLCRFELLAEAWISGIENKRYECRDADGAYLASVWQLRRCPVYASAMFRSEEKTTGTHG